MAPDRPLRRLVSVALAAALTVAFMPSATFAAAAWPAPAAARIAAVPPSAPSTWAPDPDDPGDDTPALASDLTFAVSDGTFAKPKTPPNAFGKSPFGEVHALYASFAETTAVDEDWYRFDVTDLDAAIGKPYTIEALSRTIWVKPVIEVYGPTTTATIDPTPPAECIDASGNAVPDPHAVTAVHANAEWFLGGPSAGLTYKPSLPGRYFFRIRPALVPSPEVLPEELLPSGASGAGTYMLHLKAGEITRLAGGNRVQTAVMLSRERYADGALSPVGRGGEGGAVVVANGYDYPDALAGSTLAGVLDAPLLLVHTAAYDAETKAEIERLGATRAFILGSGSAVSTAVADAIELTVGESGVTRVSGDGRVQTSIAIAQQAKAAGPLAHVAFVANGWSFPDALAASPMAAFGRAPILLTHKDFLDPEVLASLDSLGITDVVILGSTSAVGGGPEATLLRKFKSRDHVLRIAGADRYETAKKVAVWATGEQGAKVSVGASGTAEASRLPALEWSGFALATGSDYADALGGGAFAGLAGHPLLLNPSGGRISKWVWDVEHVLPSGTHAYLREASAGQGYIGSVRRSYIIGGANAVGDPVWAGLDPFVGIKP